MWRQAKSAARHCDSVPCQSFYAESVAAAKKLRELDAGRRSGQPARCRRRGRLPSRPPSPLHPRPTPSPTTRTTKTSNTRHDGKQAHMRQNPDKFSLSPQVQATKAGGRTQLNHTVHAGPAGSVFVKPASTTPPAIARYDTTSVFVNQYDGPTNSTVAGAPRPVGCDRHQELRGAIISKVFLRRPALLRRTRLPRLRPRGRPRQKSGGGGRGAARRF